MSSIKNPYNNIGSFLPPQPFGSVVDEVKNNENSLIETAGLNQYNFLDVGQELNAWKHLQQIQRSAFPPNRTNEFNTDTTNKYFPHIQPLFYKGVAQNYSLLNNPPDHNQNLDMASQRTYIKPFYTTKEQFGSVLPIEMNNSILPFGPIYIKKTVLTSNDIE
jgi:hypothetical protein